MLDVVLRCPSCGYQWLQAQIDPEAWWAKGVTPEKIAKQVGSCPQCGTKDLEVAK